MKKFKIRRMISFICALSLIIAMFSGCNSDQGNNSTKSEVSQSSQHSDGSQSEDSAADSQSTASNSEAKELVWLSQGVGDNSWEGITKPILEKYEEETGVKITGEFYSFTNLFEVIEVKIASGSADYDVISVDVPMVASYANRNMILPMDEYFTEDEINQYADASYQAGCWDGAFYAPAMNTSTQVLWFNEALLEEAGVEMPESSTEDRLTWEEVVDLAQQVQAKVDPDKTKGIFGLDFQQVSRVYQMNAIPNSMGGANIGDDGFTVDGVINNDAWVTALTWYQDLVKNGIASQGVDADEMGNYFSSGKLVFMVGGTWTARSSEGNGMTTYGWAPVPAFEGHENEVSTPTGSWHFGINAASENVDAAADFIKWFSLGEGNDMWLEINGDVPARKENLQNIIDDDNAPGYHKIGAYEALNTAVPRALTPGYNEYSTVMNAVWEDVRNGADVKQSLDNAVQQINTAMAEYQ